MFLVAWPGSALAALSLTSADLRLCNFYEESGPQSQQTGHDIPSRILSRL